MQTYPRLLSDEPATEDGMGGPHQRIACAIANLIYSSEGGKSLRLEGSWGSGKSTIVRMLIDGFEKTRHTVGLTRKASDVAIFQYDAWVHSGDPLRRAFIESLLQTVNERGWLSAETPQGSYDYWKLEVDRLARKRKVVTKNTKVSFSRPAKLMLSVGLAAAGISPFLIEAVKKALKESSIAGWVEVIGCVGIAAFAFMLTHLIGDRALNTWIKRGADEETTEIFESPDPTSVDFQDAFASLMATTLIEGRELVIVVDNLDRITDDEIKSIWSLLRSFLENTTFRQKGWFKRLWVMVPMAGLSRHVRDGVADMATEGATDEREIVLDKVFQVTFRLPPPMLASWKDYMATCLVQAFGPDEANSFAHIQRLYEIRITQPISITPRRIVTFVNDLVAMKIEWSNRAGLPELAAYVLFRNQLGPNHEAPDLVKNVLGAKRVDGIFPMLHLHAESPEDAAYLTLRPRIELALQTADATALAALMEESASAPYVLDRFVLHDLKLFGSQQAAILSAVQALTPFFRAQVPGGGSDLLRTTGLVHLRTVLLDIFSQIDRFNLRDKQAHLGLQAFLDVLDDKLEGAILVIRMLQNLGQPQGPGMMDLLDDMGQDDWYDCILSVASLPAVADTLEAAYFKNYFVGPVSESQARALVTMDGQIRLPIRLQVSAEQWPAFSLRAERSNHQRAAQYFVCREGEDALIYRIANSFISAELKEDYLYLMYTPEAWQPGSKYFPRVLSEYATKLSVASAVDVAALEDTLRSLIAIRPDEAREALRAHLPFDVTVRLVGSAMFGALTKPFPFLLLLQLWVHGGKASAAREEQLLTLQQLDAAIISGSSARPDLAAACAKILVETKMYGALASIHQGWGPVRFLRDILHSMAMNESFKEWLAYEYRSALPQLEFIQQVGLPGELYPEFIQAVNVPVLEDGDAEEEIVAP